MMAVGKCSPSADTQGQMVMPVVPSMEGTLGEITLRGTITFGTIGFLTRDDDSSKLNLIEY